MTVSLPLYPQMTDRDVSDVINAVREIVTTYRVAGRSGKGMARAAAAEAV